MSFFFYRYGADVNATTFYNEQFSYKDTPLHFAVINRYKNCALRLIQANANLNCRNEPHGKSPVELAREFQLGIYQYMENLARTPPSLKHQCYSLIRHCLKPDVVTRVNQLSIPLELKTDMLLLKPSRLQEW